VGCVIYGHAQTQTQGPIPTPKTASPPPLASNPQAAGCGCGCGVRGVRGASYQLCCQLPVWWQAVPAAGAILHIAWCYVLCNNCIYYMT
jgi:hypothetical protein